PFKWCMVCFACCSGCRRISGFAVGGTFRRFCKYLATGFADSLRSFFTMLVAFPSTDAPRFTAFRAVVVRRRTTFGLTGGSQDLKAPSDVRSWFSL
ncbi:hypothetical protein F5J12DRAFT_832657, partial [Pisolithus orientalis]|uniref:uncharacterized protein n=1 Tax=Pisolithus orientalis TaxID=936130 RepID=UPI002224D44C